MNGYKKMNEYNISMEREIRNQKLHYKNEYLPVITIPRQRNYPLAIYHMEVEKPETENEAALGDILTHRINTVKDSIIELKLRTEERKTLHSRIMQSLDSLILEARNRVISIKDRGLAAKQPELIRRRTMLEENVNFLENQKLTEQLQFWKDTVEIQKELKFILEEEKTMSLVEHLEISYEEPRN